jgi:hypothetical protein
MAATFRQKVTMAEAQTNSAVRLTKISPQFAVPDVVVAAEYYRDKLGFQILGYFWDPPVYSIVRRDSVEIHFGKLDAGMAPPRISSAGKEASTPISG